MFPPHMPEWIHGLILQSDEFIKRSQERGHPTESQMANQTENLDEDVPF